jgi:RNA polymerase sigma-70 factor (ECF subfamily)
MAHEDVASLTDDELAARAVNSPAHFDELVRRHEDRIFALALRMTGNRSDALDATQDAFLAAYRRRQAFEGRSAYGTWLYRIAINACHDLLRKKRDRLLDDEDEISEQAAPTNVGGDVALRVDISRALAQLPAEYREAVVMHDIGGIPYEQIAEIAGCQIGTVKSRISRGRRRLADLLEPGGDASTSKELET